MSAACNEPAGPDISSSDSATSCSRTTSSSSPSPTPTISLPGEVVEHILAFIDDDADVLAASRVCWTWRHECLRRPLHAEHTQAQRLLTKAGQLQRAPHAQSGTSSSVLWLTLAQLLDAAAPWRLASLRGLCGQRELLCSLAGLETLEVFEYAEPLGPRGLPAIDVLDIGITLQDLCLESHCVEDEDGRQALGRIPAARLSSAPACRLTRLSLDNTLGVTALPGRLPASLTCVELTRCHSLRPEGMAALAGVPQVALRHCHGMGRLPLELAEPHARLQHLTLENVAVGDLRPAARLDTLVLVRCDCVSDADLRAVRGVRRLELEACKNITTLSALAQAPEAANEPLDEPLDEAADLAEAEAATEHLRLELLSIPALVRLPRLQHLEVRCCPLLVSLAPAGAAPSLVLARMTVRQFSDFAAVRRLCFEDCSCYDSVQTLIAAGFHVQLVACSGLGMREEAATAPVPEPPPDPDTPCAHFRNCQLRL